MRLELDWIIKQPIDFEHKEYILLDYLSKIEGDFDNFKIYPAFQELSLHLANIMSIIEKESYISLNRKMDEIDDEVLLADLKYNKITFSSIEERNEVMLIADFAKERFRNLFIIGKAMWSLVYDSVMVRLINKLKDKAIRDGSGIFYFKHKGIFYIYEYQIKKVNELFDENKCQISQIYFGEEGDIYEIISYNLDIDDDWKEKLPIFEVTFNSEFSLDGSLLSLTKRKIMNYIFQTVKIEKIKTGV